MRVFQQGLDLCESFFQQVAKPILDVHFPSLQYSAGLIGCGSEVLGYDDEMSTDHMWGPRFQLFLPEQVFEIQRNQISEAFALHFPYEFGGYSTNFSPPDEKDSGVRTPLRITSGKVDPLVEYHTLPSFFQDYLGYTLSDEISDSQWLTFSEHRLLGLTSGRLFHDDLGLDLVRQKFHYFPEDVWLWMMASQWKMIAEEEAFAGRCGFVGDDLGSRLIAARQVQRIMRLGFMLEKRYAPYSKWFGTAFNQLRISVQLNPVFEKVLCAQGWKEREDALAQAYKVAAEKHNSLGITDLIDTKIENFFNRPFKVIHAEKFSGAILQAVQNDDLKHTLPLTGTPTQFTDYPLINDNLSISEQISFSHEQYLRKDLQMVLPTPEPPRDCLIIVDMQNYFFRALDRRYNLENAIHNINQLIDDFDARGLPVYHVISAYKADGSDWELKTLASGQPEEDLEGSQLAEVLSGINVRNHHTTVIKTRYSAFFKTNLAEQLAAQQINRVVVVGAYTHYCVNATVFDAYCHDFVPCLITDAVISHRRSESAVMVRRMKRNGYHLFTTAEYLNANRQGG
jgi:nicotinamidase-related amidase